MSGKKTSLITVQDKPITVMRIDREDFICLTDMAKARTDASRAADVIKNWLRSRTTLEYLGTWEVMYNPVFKVVEFDHFKTEPKSLVERPGFFVCPLRMEDIPLQTKRRGFLRS